MRFALVLLLFAANACAQAPAVESRQPDVIYVPTPQDVVEEMLKLAKVGKNDVLYDLGSGDGRIPVTAAKRFGIRATGIDIDPQRIAEANENAKKNGVTHLVQFKREDLFKTRFSDATVVTLYLLPDLNVKLRPRLLAELKPGTRIVSHQFDMGTWKPERKVELSAGRVIYLWTIPERTK
jgi:trans-aconitate methyltransferase